MAKSSLEAAGIEAMIQADSVGGMRPHIAWTSGGFKVWSRRGRGGARNVLEPLDEAGVDDKT